MQKKQNVFMIILYNHPILKLRFPIVVRCEVVAVYSDQIEKVYENVPEVIKMWKTLRSGKKNISSFFSLFFIVKIIGNHSYFF